MNQDLYWAARNAGCTAAEAEVLAVYVVSDKVADAAAKIGISEQTAKNHLARIRRRLKVHHTAAVVAKLAD